MFAVNIALGNTVWRLLYKDGEQAKAAYELISNPIVENLILDDDFGQQFCAKVSSIHGFMLEAEARLREALAAKTLADLAGEFTQKAPPAFLQATQTWFTEQKQARPRSRKAPQG